MAGHIRSISTKNHDPPMNATLRFLADFCRAHRLDEKIFLVPSFTVGHQIGESLARAGEAWINLRFITLPTLAHEVAALRIVALEKKQAAETELLIGTDGLFRELRDAGLLTYFDKLNPTPGIVQ